MTNSLSIEDINNLQVKNNRYKEALDEIKSYCICCGDGLRANKIVEYIDEVLDEA